MQNVERRLGTGKTLPQIRMDGESSIFVQNISHLYSNEENIPNDNDNPLVLAMYYMTYKIGESLFLTRRINFFWPVAVAEWLAGLTAC